MRQVAAILVLTALAGCSRDDTGAAPVVTQSPEAALPVRLLAAGNEPFWSARIRANRLDFSLADPGNARRIDVMRTAVGKGIVLDGTADGLPVRAQVMPADCSDGMTGQTYAYSIELKIGDSTFNGCAREDPGGKPAS